MPNNVRVLANAESITTNNQASEQDSFLTYSHEYVKGLLKKIQSLEDEKLKYYNESIHYQYRCIELFEKLQEQQTKGNVTTMRVAR